MLFESVNRFNVWQMVSTSWLDAHNLFYFSKGFGLAVYVQVCFVNYIIQSNRKRSINPSSFQLLMAIWFSKPESINKEYLLGFE